MLLTITFVFGIYLGNLIINSFSNFFGKKSDSQKNNIWLIFPKEIADVIPEIIALKFSKVIASNTAKKLRNCNPKAKSERILKCNVIVFSKKSQKNAKQIFKGFTNKTNIPIIILWKLSRKFPNISKQNVDRDSWQKKTDEVHKVIIEEWNMLGNSESKYLKRIKSYCEIYFHTIIVEIVK